MADVLTAADSGHAGVAQSMRQVQYVALGWLCNQPDNSPPVPNLQMPLCSHSLSDDDLHCQRHMSNAKSALIAKPVIISTSHAGLC